VHPFRAAIEARDLDAAVGLLADDVVFRSPVVFRPYEGRAAVEPILRAAFGVFEEFRYVREIGAPGGGDHALVFRARVGDREIEGVDLLLEGDEGAVGELTVMVRPLTAAVALAQAMQARLSAAGA
jgi:SnoaL-like domain